MTENILEVRNLKVEYGARKSRRNRKSQFTAVNHVSFVIRKGTTLGLVGESGSGKSSTGMGLLRLTAASSGSVIFEGQDIFALSGRELRQIRRDMQIVFQNPYASMDPRMTIRRILMEPVRIHPDLRLGSEVAPVEAALEMVGLNASDADKYPAEFSGGQLQRIAIARALMPRPDFLVCDEAVSALDVSTQGQILRLLSDVQRETGISILFIAHNLAVVRNIADDIGVMYSGDIVELGSAESVVNEPAHPYTALLIGSVPSIAVSENVRTLDVVSTHAEPADPANPPPGCKFNPRCPFAMEICTRVAPTARPTKAGGMVACHLHDHGPKLAGGSMHELDAVGR
jgi:peptide/nickel transport system ATP-binding protein